MSNYLSEAFKKLEILDEDVFDLDKDGLTALKDFEDKDEEDDSIAVIDPDAESEEDLEDSYIGKVILDCSVCHTDIYKDKEDIIIDEEAGLANIGEECPYCYSSEGFKVIGEVKPFVETTFETEDDVDVEVDGEEVEDEDMNESLEDNEQEVIGIGWSRQSVPEFKNWLKQHPSHKIWKDGNRYLLGRSVDDGYSMAISVDDVNKLRKDKFFLSRIEDINESLRRNRRLRESIKDWEFFEATYDDPYAPYTPKMYIKYPEGNDTLQVIIYPPQEGASVNDIDYTDWGAEIYSDDDRNISESEEGFSSFDEAEKWVNSKLSDLGIVTESLKESTGEVFHNDNGLNYTVVERSKSGKNALLNRGKQWIIAWNCPQDNNGSWGQGHYFFDESEARELWNKKYIKESKFPMKISKRPIKESCSINQCQKWVDYDMKKYKRISDDTMEKIKSSGYSVVKDQYGDYEIITDRKDEACHGRNSRKMKESIEDIKNNIYTVSIDYVPDSDCDNEADVINDVSRELNVSPQSVAVNYLHGPGGGYPEISISGTLSDLYRILLKYTAGDKEDVLDILDNFSDVDIDVYDYFNESLKESIEDITIDTGDQEISVSARDKEKKSDGEMITPLSDEVKSDIEMNSDDVDVDVDEFSEEDFDELGESYLKKVYENVNSYRTISAKTQGNKLFVEGLIKFNSGKEKKTSFVFESRTITKSGKAKLIGENLQISRGHKSFKLTGTINNGKFISESLNYNYRVKNGSESQRVYGTAKKSK